MEEEIKKSGGKKAYGSKKRMRMWLKMKELWKYKFRSLGSAFKWKRLNIRLSFFDDLVFKVASVLEAIVLVATLCFFYLSCGCHF